MPVTIQSTNLQYKDSQGNFHGINAIKGDTGGVESVAGKTGAVTLDGNDVTFNDAATYNDGTIGGAVADLKSAVDNLETEVDRKQDALIFDDAPAANSTNPVKSGGVKTALNDKEDTSNKITTITNASTNTQYPSAAAVWALFNSISNADATSY